MPRCSAAGAAGRAASTACARAARERGIALLALGGEAEPDAEMTALSTAPAGAVAQAGEYLRHGDVDNVEQLLRFLADTFLLEGHGFDAAARGRRPRRLPAGPRRRGAGAGARGARPGAGRRSASASTARTGSPATPRSSTALCAAIEDAGANALAVWSYTLRRDRDGRVPALELLDGHVDALLMTMLATGGSGAADKRRRRTSAGRSGTQARSRRSTCR